MGRILGALAWAALAQTALAQDQGPQLRAAVVAGDTATVKKLVTSKITVNAANSDGVTPLMIAAGLGRTDLVRILLEAGADMEATTSKERITALFFAADMGQLEAAGVLVDNGANVNARDQTVGGATALDWAVTPHKGESEADTARGTAVAKYLATKGGVSGVRNNVLGLLMFAPDEAKAEHVPELLERAKAETSPPRNKTTGVSETPRHLQQKIMENERETLNDIRSVIAAERTFASANGGFYASLDCLSNPWECLPGYPKGAPQFVSNGLASLPPWTGYMRKFYSGASVTPDNLRDSVSSSSISSFAYTAVPIRVGETGIRGFCGDSEGRICFTNDGSEPAVRNGLCAAPCNELH